jgi:hypothetical protein
MRAYRVMPIPEAVSKEVRGTMRSPQYGHPAYCEVAAGYGPCRSCLKTFREGQEKRILFTYNPFDGVEAYPEPGPIFVHAEHCTAFAGEGFPNSLRTLPLTLEAFADRRWIVRREHLEGCDPDAVIQEMLADPSVAYIHVRNTEAGCFIARIEPVAAEPTGARF